MFPIILQLFTGYVKFSICFCVIFIYALLSVNCDFEVDMCNWVAGLPARDDSMWRRDTPPTYLSKTPQTVRKGSQGEQV